MAPELIALTVDAYDPGRLAGFWAAVLGRVVVDEPWGVLLPGSGTQVGLRFAPGGTAGGGPHRVHLHLTSTTHVAQLETVAAALDLGAAHLDVGQLPEEGHVVLSDPEGNEFCVIRPGSPFLAGCGLLGEIACDGSRQVGLFWAGALGWPLVWDEDGETAIQSPQGGTKIAWGGPPVAPKAGRNPQRLELRSVSDDLSTEVDRLVALGATLSGSAAGVTVELTDPDGNEFSLTGGGTAEPDDRAGRRVR